MMRPVVTTCAALAAATLLSGCADMVASRMASNPPTLTQITEENLALRMLPPPSQRIPVAVYDLPDLTGQFRERENVQSMSRAVSQGGGGMLIKALKDAGERRWFSVLDRSNLDNLLRERQIVTEMRRLYRGETEPNPAAIAPLRHAGIIIEGAIVGYDSNVQTGGFGARYLGIGGDTQWKLDIVTVNLRAVATGTGEVLASVMVEKPIASTMVRGGVFSYVELDRLLEIETGVAANEPKQLALQMAVEKAVLALIMEGAEVGVWRFADARAGEALLQAHRAEKYRGTPLAGHGARAAAPDTRNAAHVVPTQPRPRDSWPDRNVRQRALSPQPPQNSNSSETARPPAPGAPDEVIG